eukprot:5842717-Amphidinium_carterae.1
METPVQACLNGAFNGGQNPFPGAESCQMKVRAGCELKAKKGNGRGLGWPIMGQPLSQNQS